MVGETPLHCAVNHSSLLTAGMLISCLSDNQLIHYSSLLRRLQVSIQFITFNSVDLLHCVPYDSYDIASLFHNVH